jgi:hypothetical protein
MQFHLSKYAYLLESSLLSDAVSLVPKVPEDGPGLKVIMESIDNRADFKDYVQAYRVAHQGTGRGPQREDPVERGFVSSFAFCRRKNSSVFTASPVSLCRPIGA